MHNVLVLGAGKIGSLIATLLHTSGDYRVHLADIDTDAVKRLAGALGLPARQACTMDVLHKGDVERFLRERERDALISSLPFYCNSLMAELARAYGQHYFYLTEDVEVTNQIHAISDGADRVFIPQCGLAPGFISIAAHDLMTHFDSVDTVKMRVGALPVHPSNALKYSLTWSTDGVINEYGNLCYAIEQGKDP